MEFCAREWILDTSINSLCIWSEIWCTDISSLHKYCQSFEWFFFLDIVLSNYCTVVFEPSCLSAGVVLNNYSIWFFSLQKWQPNHENLLIICCLAMTLLVFFIIICWVHLFKMKLNSINFVKAASGNSSPMGYICSFEKFRKSLFYWLCYFYLAIRLGWPNSQ